MDEQEIPLLRQSAAYAERLIAAVRRFGDARYHFHRRVNWSYRYADAFYASEARAFKAGPWAYLDGRAATPPDVEEVYSLRLRGRQILVILLKVLAHWLFRAAGHLIHHPADLSTYRKAYVDDIELVFDPQEKGVIRAVYPFPLNLRRQIRYLRYLRHERLAFTLTGNAYLPSDLWRFLRRRNVGSLMRMESRAQILNARQIASSGIRSMQLSDEFDIGSLDFTRFLARAGISVVNSAHGVGKYLPMHAYPVFHVLTRRQQHYYHAVRDCRYVARRLNDRPPPRTHGTPDTQAGAAPGIVTLVFLSQAIAGLTDLIADCEVGVLTRLREELASIGGVTLLYKPHPNSQQREVPAGFRIVDSLDGINGRAGTLFVSFYSTCQIDPAFKGRKVLLRGDLIHPEIVFDDSEAIVDVDQLIALVRQMLADERAALTSPHSRSRTAITVPDWTAS